MRNLHCKQNWSAADKFVAVVVFVFVVDIVVVIDVDSTGH